MHRRKKPAIPDPIAAIWVFPFTITMRRIKLSITIALEGMPRITHSSWSPRMAIYASRGCIAPHTILPRFHTILAINCNTTAAGLQSYKIIRGLKFNELPVVPVVKIPVVTTPVVTLPVPVELPVELTPVPLVFCPLKMLP
jgi:hypothetical protein